MAALIWRIRGIAAPRPGPRAGGVGWVVPAAAAALLVAAITTVSPQAACGVVLIVLVVALHRQNRDWGVIALLVLWFLTPMIRRMFGLVTGYLSTDPLSVAPFVAAAAVAGMELLRLKIPTRIRRILLLAAAGFVVGLPLAVLQPQAGLYALVAYLAGLSGAVLGLTERSSLQRSTLRRVLLFGIPPIALYAIVFQRILPLPSWDQTWLDAIDFNSIGASNGHVRIFGTLNAPGTLAPLLGLSLLCLLTVTRARRLAALTAVVLMVTLSLTYVRSIWLALIAGGLAHVIATRGRSARVVFGAAAVTVAVTVALAPVNQTARSVLDRFNTIGSLNADTSATDRSTTASQMLPLAARAPIGHGLGSAGEPSKLNPSSALRFPDNGYLSLMYQVGPIGFALVILAIALITRAAWRGTRARAPGRELRQLLFAMWVFMLVTLLAGDDFYGALGLVFWFIAGQVLAFEYGRRSSAHTGSPASPPEPPELIAGGRSR